MALSYSRWSDFAICAKQFWFKYVDPAREKKPGFDRAVQAVGVEAHESIEGFLKGDSVAPEMSSFFAPKLADLQGLAKSETQFAFKADWTPCDWFDKEAEHRMELDAFWLDNVTANLVDFKNGKVKATGWRDQLEYYAIAIFLTFPEAKMVHAELWYILHDHISRDRIFRWELPGLLTKWADRATKIAVGPYPRRPSGFCKVCKFYFNNGGPCDGSPESA